MSQNNNISCSGGDNCDHPEGEIDIALILSIIYKDKFLIVFLCLFFAMCSYGFSLTLPNKYKATVILAPSQKDSGGQLSGIASQYGGLAAMAGISLGKESDKTDQAIALLKSWPFIDFVVGKYNLGADILAAKGFDKKSKRLLYDQVVYDEKSKAWISSKFKDSEGAPSSWMFYKKINEMVAVQSDKKTGLITISVTHVSPVIAKNWLDILTRELNLHFQLIDKEAAKKNIAYLEAKIDETSIAEMQSVFFNMVEAQTKVLMLTEGSEDYLFKVLVRPMVPEEKDSPRRSVFAALGGGIGFLVWCCIVVVKLRCLRSPR